MSSPLTTRVLKVDALQPDAQAIAQAAQLIRKGRLVAFPTETVYGLGANALDPIAIEGIYLAKQRPASDPVIAHIHDHAELDLLAAQVPQAAYTLAQRFWPGPLTLVLKRAPNVPANIASGLATVAIRMPAHPVARALLLAAGVPIAAPSANTFTRPSATTAAHVLEDLNGRVDLILDAGPSTIGLESTVLDLTGETPVILRPGGVSLADLQSVLPEVRLAPRYVRDEATSSPGQMLKHYSPRAELLLYTGAVDAVRARMATDAITHLAQGKRVGLLIAAEDRAHFSGQGLILQVLGSENDLQGVGQRLFAGLRELDQQSADIILARDFGREGLGVALWDRLLRAAEGHVIEA